VDTLNGSASGHAKPTLSLPCPIAIYGPPGAGKTSLIAAAQARDIPAMDLESTGNDYHSRRDALAALILTGLPSIIGAADATPEDFPSGTWFVLLAPGPDELERRVRARGDRRDLKWVDHAHQVRLEHLAMADAGVFDQVIQGACSPDAVLDLILRAVAHPALPGR
jgi:hypothetical protein